jgi:hypothetical protein
VTDYQSILDGYRARIAWLESRVRELRTAFPSNSDEADAFESEAAALRITLFQTMRSYSPEAAAEDDKDEEALELEEQARLEIEADEQGQAEQSENRR